MESKKQLRKRVAKLPATMVVKFLEMYRDHLSESKRDDDSDTITVEGLVEFIESQVVNSAHNTFKIVDIHAKNLWYDTAKLFEQLKPDYKDTTSLNESMYNLDDFNELLEQSSVDYDALSDNAKRDISYIRGLLSVNGASYVRIIDKY